MQNSNQAPSALITASAVSRRSHIFFSPSFEPLDQLERACCYWADWNSLLAMGAPQARHSVCPSRSRAPQNRGSAPES